MTDFFGDYGSLLGIGLSLLVLIVLAYHGISVIVLAPISALFAVIISGQSHELLGVYTQVFMTKLGGYIVSFFPLFLLGAIFGKMMDDSGAARSISSALVKKLGHQQAMLAIVLACAILTYGGVSLFVVGFAVYPIAASLFKATDIPKRLIPGAIALGAISFTMTAIPGTPAIQNTIPTKFFGTDTFAAPILGIIAAIIMFLGGMLWLNYRVKKAKVNSEGYGNHDDNLSEYHHPVSMHILVALLPIFVVIVVNFISTKFLIPWMDTSYLSKSAFGSASIESVRGIWSIIIALSLASVVLAVTCRKRWLNLRKTVNSGALGSLLPIFNTASEVGYGGVIATLAGFTILQHFLLGISPGNPLISEAVIIASLAGITGSASGGLSIALETMSGMFIELANTTGISLDLMHRVAALASGGLDCLPHNGAVISMLTICGLTHRSSYFDVFVVAVVVPSAALIAVIALGTVFGSF